MPRLPAVWERSGPRFAAACGLCLALFLSACGDESDQPAATETPSAPARTAAQPAASPELPAPAPPARSYLPPILKEMREEAPASEAARHLANAQLAYANEVMEWQLSKNAGYALWLYLGADFYMREAALPKLVKRPPRFARSKALVPPDEWPKDSARAIREALTEMDAAVDEEREQYEKLVRYALDDSIVDDGKLGRRYLKAIGEQWQRYESARRRLRDEVESGAIAAEAVTLQGHPLRSQILAVRILFRRMKEARALLGEREADKKTIMAWRQELEGILDEAAFLPFAVPGEPERLWREFLRTARRFPDVVSLGEAQGFHPEVRRQLNEAFSHTENAYNAFVDAVH
ncbi:hypothetical protein [uncultured Desulfovibrio sp.]|uniref:DUF3829 domain-containing protein n=1 Tax=Candidatus Desulfovibrio intestinavium TaxID=2838534 RepID=A0A9D2HLQ1_9BACT|nr:hypothetical protein [uncultured Desulfovibrio sp.]HJA78385.1 hypothetical protein [Candidatus Desulfovibrio intestinavium]